MIFWPVPALDASALPALPFRVSCPPEESGEAQRARKAKGIGRARPKRQNRPTSFRRPCHPHRMPKQLKRAKPADVAEILETLVTLGRARKNGGKFSR